jgi:teichuronic acid biosynthesis glycosyltransferase TuaG
MLMRNGTICYGLNEVLSHYRVMSKSLSSNKWKSVKQVWEIQTQDEKINKVSAAFNVCCFIVNAFIKHFLH